MTSMGIGVSGLNDKTSCILRQQAKTGEQRYFELKAGKELHVTHSKKGKSQEYALSILALAEEGKRLYKFRKRWLIPGLCSALAMLLLFRLQLFLPSVLEAYLGYILAALFCLSLLSFVLTYHTFERRYVFHSVHTKLPLVELWVDNPSPEAYQEFISVLEKTIKRYRVEMNIPYDKQRAGELRTLRRVTEAGILTQSDYLAAKTKLLAMADVQGADR